MLRIISLEPSGGDIKGVVVPDTVSTEIFAIMGADTIASTFTNTTNGNYLFTDVPAGNYSLSFIPSDTSFRDTTRPASVTLGQITVVDTVVLQK